MSPPDPDPLSSVGYSCLYWVDHLKDSDPSGGTGDCKDLQDDGVVHGFIRDKYLYWLESLSLLHNMAAGVMAVHKLEDLMVSYSNYISTREGLTWKQRKTGGQQLAALLSDARRFVLFHRSVIEIAPLQAYASALVFSPERSLVRELFKKEEPDWMILKPRMESDWNAYLHTLEGHSNWVSAVAFSPDGKTIVSGSSDHTIRLWDAATGVHQHTLEGHSHWVSAVAFSPDGKTIVSGSSDRTIRLWDAATSVHQHTLEVGFIPYHLWFSEDGQYLKTDRGELSLGSALDAVPRDHSVPNDAIFVESEWVIRGGKKLLWLPHEYRATCVAVYHGRLALGHATGRVTFFQLA